MARTILGRLPYAGLAALLTAAVGEWWHAFLDSNVPLENPYGVGPALLDGHGGSQAEFEFLLDHFVVLALGSFTVFLTIVAVGTLLEAAYRSAEEGGRSASDKAVHWHVLLGLVATWLAFLGGLTIFPARTSVIALPGTIMRLIPDPWWGIWFVAFSSTAPVLLVFVLLAAAGGRGRAGTDPLTTSAATFSGALLGILAIELHFLAPALLATAFTYGFHILSGVADPRLPSTWPETGLHVATAGTIYIPLTLLWPSLGWLLVPLLLFLAFAKVAQRVRFPWEL